MEKKQKFSNQNMFILKKVYFLGIGGVGMSALASYVMDLGIEVYGSDATKNLFTEQLSAKGAKITIGHDASVPVGIDCCVVSGAINPKDGQIAQCVKSGAKIFTRGEFLGLVMSRFKKSVAIAGSHGKTTTTALAYSVLSSCGQSSALFLGGRYNGENYFKGEGDFCLAEACEYQRAFLSLSPLVSVLLNADYDHVDCYSSPQDLQNAFFDFANNTRSGGCVVAEEGVAKLLFEKGFEKKVITFGTQDKDNCRYFADNLKEKDGVYSFDLFEGKKFLQSVTPSIVGKHAIYSCLAVFAVARFFGFERDAICDGISKFKGVERRWQTFASNYTNVVADYAHHPTEITNLLNTATKMGYDKIYVLFQPHTYSRTKVLLKEFGKSFRQAHEVVVLPVYSAREEVLSGGESKDLVAEINKHTLALEAEDFIHAKKLLQSATKKDLLLVVGAGDVIDFCQAEYLNL